MSRERGERFPWPLSPENRAQVRFSSMIQYLRRSEADSDEPRRFRINRGVARLFADAILDMPIEQRRGITDRFRALAQEDQQMARAVYQAFRSTRVLPVSELRGFLGLPPRGHLFPKKR